MVAPYRSADELDMFSEFYAVVLDHQKRSGRRVRWSPTHDGWLRNSDYGRYLEDPWLDELGATHGAPDGPNEKDRTAAVSLAKSVVRSENGPFFCQRCLRSSASSHFIAPDIYGDPELYCVQVPDYSVVDSSGRGGRVKHWGSPFGCHSVKPDIDSDVHSHRRYTGPRAAYVFGRPLPADEVINREWCSRCHGAATNVRTKASEQGEGWIREEVRNHVHLLRRSLGEYYGER